MTLLAMFLGIALFVSSALGAGKYFEHVILNGQVDVCSDSGAAINATLATGAFRAVDLAQGARVSGFTILNGGQAQNASSAVGLGEEGR